MNTKTLLTILATVFIYGLGFTQQTAPTHNPLDQYLIAPELVMAHQQAISLSEEQKELIKKEITSAQTSLNDLHWDLNDEMHRFTELLSPAKIDEEKSLSQLTKILDIETQIKKAQMTLMIRIKNHLTAQQQLKLSELRNK